MCVHNSMKTPHSGFPKICFNALNVVVGATLWVKGTVLIRRDDSVKAAIINTWAPAAIGF